MIKVLVIGRIGTDPVDGKDQKGTDVTTFSLAGLNFSKTEETTWFNCLTYGKTRDTVKNYTKKGQRLFVEGRLMTVAAGKGKQQFLSVSSVTLIEPKPDAKAESKEEESDGDAPF